MRLRDYEGGGIYEEARYNLQYGLCDYHWARYFVRRLGQAERERFSEHGWAYGDPSYFYGGDVMEVLAYQATVVVKTLFGGGVACDLLAYVSDDEELYRRRASLLDKDGLRAFGTFEEQLAIYGEHPYGDSSTLFAEVTGDAESIWRIRGALAEVSPNIAMYYYDPDSDHATGADRSEHFVLAYESEYYPEREVVHYELFETLLRAWEAMQTPQKTPQEVG